MNRTHFLHRRLCVHTKVKVHMTTGRMRCVQSYICCTKWEFKYSRRCRSVQSLILLLWCVLPFPEMFKLFHEMCIAPVRKKQFRLGGVYESNQSASNSPIRAQNSPAHFHENEYSNLYCFYFSLPMIIIFSLIVCCIVLLNKLVTIERYLCKLKTFN